MKLFAKGKLKIGKRNKTELAYEQYLELLKKAGEILWWKYEGLKFRLGEGAYFTPDFVVMNKEGYLEAHEVKGFWREAARVRIKAAAEMYPIRFIAVTKNGQGWKEEIFE